MESNVLKPTLSDAYIIIVDSEAKLLNTLNKLSRYTRLAVDTEGDNLGRKGQLTVFTLQGIDDVAEKDTPIFVVDVLTLGGERVFSKTLPSLKFMLEDSAITKITFDCRTDSDALMHQHGLSLAGTLDLQIFDQAVRIQQGELPPQRTNYFKNGGIPYLSSMKKILSRYSLSKETSELKSNCPHQSHLHIWKERPLASSCIDYAANDVKIINQLWRQMSNSHVSSILMERTLIHSKRYESMFRDRPNEVSLIQDKEFIMEEHGIILESELPLNHPRRPRKNASYTIQRWDKAVNALKSKLPNAYNEVMFILQHDDWYTDEGMKEIKRLASDYPFTAKQRNKISNPPSLRREEDFYDNSCYGYGDY